MPVSSKVNKKKQLVSVYVMTVFEEIAGGLFGIFVPTYLLNLGFSIANVLNYFFFYSLFALIFFFVAAKFANRFGLRITILMRFPFLFAYLWLLLALPKIPGLPLILVSLATGMQAAFYFFALHVLFASNAGYKDMSKEIGRFYFWPQVFGLFLPLLGGLILKFFNFQALFLTSCVFYILAALPLWFVSDFKTNVRFSVQNFYKLANTRRRYASLEIVKNITEEVEGIIWPIFVYLTVRNFVSLGMIGTFLGAGGAIFTWLVARYVDRLSSRRVLRFGAIAMCFLWILRFFSANQPLFYLLTIAAGFLGALVNVPFSSMMYRTAKQSEADEFFLFREIPVFIGRIPVYLLAMLYPNNLRYGFLLAAGAYLILALAVPKHKIAAGN